MDFNPAKIPFLLEHSSASEFSGGESPYFTAVAPPISGASFSLTQRRESMDAGMREAIFRMAVMQPVQAEAGAAPRRRNVKISKDPQSVAARHRRERISQRMRTLQRMVPGGSKLDTASMLDEAVHYLKFLKKQVEMLQQLEAHANCWINMSNANCNYTNVYATSRLD